MMDDRALGMHAGITRRSAAASPHTNAAFEEAHRAVSEIAARQTFPFVRTAR